MKLTDEQAEAIIAHTRSKNKNRHSFFEILIRGRTGAQYPMPTSPDIGMGLYWANFAIDRGLATHDSKTNTYTLTDSGIAYYEKAIGSYLNRNGMPIELDPMWGAFG